MSDFLRPHGPYSPCNSLGQNTGADSLSIIQGIFPTQRWNQGLLHCGQILYQLNTREAQESWSRLSIPSPADFSDRGIEPGSPVLQADSLPTELCNSTIRKNEIRPFIAIWLDLDLEIIILGKVSQREKDKYHVISLTCEIFKTNKKRYKWTNVQNRNKSKQI